MTRTLDPGNAVHQIMTRLTSAFARTGHAPSSTNGSLDSLLAAALDAIGWIGSARQIAEAHPYLERLDTLAKVRATLHRLGVETKPVMLSATSLRPSHVPCFVELAETSEVVLVLAVGPTTAHALDRQDRVIELPLDTVAGWAWHVHLPSDHAGEPPRGSWVYRFLTSCTPDLGRILGVSLVINVLGLTSALFALAVYDFAIAAEAYATLTMLLAGTIAVLASEHVLRRRRAGSVAHLAARFDARAATATFAKVLSLPLALTAGAGLGSQLARFRQFRLGSNLFTGNLAGAMFDLPFTLLSFGLLFVLGGTIGFVPVALAAVLAMVFIVSAPRTAALAREAAEQKARSDTLLVEIATKHDTIREADIAEAMRKRAGEAYQTYLVARFRAQHSEALLLAVSQAIVGLAGVGVLCLGAHAVMTGSLSTGALIAMMAIVWRVLHPIQTVCMSLHKLQQFAATVHQIDQLMKQRGEAPESRTMVAPRTFQGHVRLREVSLRYPGRLDFGLRAIDLTMAAGSLVAITGSGGSGKSTLLKAILGLYPAQTGRVTIDGVDLRQIDASELRQASYYLPQDPVLFYGTISQNVRLAAPDATDDDVAKALALFGVHPGNPLLPDGFDTRVGGWARQPSAASLVQRIALAAAFIRTRPLVLLDNPAQHLDAEGDRALIATLSARRQRGTVLLVTQRPSHMQICDRVVVMNEGAIAAQGTPSEILPLIVNRPAAGQRAA